MNSEIEILKRIWENNRDTYLRLISNQTGFGIDYVRYLCDCLLKKGQIEPAKEKRDWYRITVKGKKELELLGIIKPKVSRKVSAIEKVVYYFPKKLKMNSGKSNLREVSFKKPKGNLIPAEEKKLNLGGIIAKAVSFLKSLKRSEKEG